MHHIQLLKDRQLGGLRCGKKDLLVRALGRFYTHPVVGRHVASAVARVRRRWGGDYLSIVDPFCGDGRLICWLLEYLSPSFGRKKPLLTVNLWDSDKAALYSARRNVAKAVSNQGIAASIKPVCWDTFVQASYYQGAFDIVITNPPWEVLKPDQRELAALDEKTAAQYIEHLKRRQALLEELFPVSKPTTRYSRWGLNLARCGTEVAFRLTAPSGVVAVVSPVSLLADQASRTLREWIVTNFTIKDIAYFPAEARLFENVDQPAVTVVCSQRAKRPSNELAPMLSRYDSAGRLRARKKLRLHLDTLRRIDYIIPAHFGGGAIPFLEKWKDFPSFSELEDSRYGLVAGRELDETRYKSFLGTSGSHLFLKGRMIGRFRITEFPTRYVRTDGPRIPPSADVPRIAWRDVSRPSQKRRMQAALIPGGLVTGNSLNIAYFRNGELEPLKALLAQLNSLVFEFQLRLLLATAHVSLGSVRKVRIAWPLSDGDMKILVYLSDQRTKGDGKSLVDLEVVVAKLYHLTRDEYKVLLKCFPKISQEESRLLLGSEMWESN